MDYKEKYEKALATARKLYNEAKANEYTADMEDYETIFHELKESEDERIRKNLIGYIKGISKNEVCEETKDSWIAWLEKQGSEPNWCHHKVDLSNCSEEYCKAYYDGWNNCNMQHSQCKSESNDVVKCLINGMKFYYEDNEEATWGTEKFSMKVKDILSWLEKQGEQSLAWSEEDEKIYQSIMDDTVQENQLISNQINWLRDIKYRYFPQLKQKWSEEDEDILNTIINHFEIDLECTKNDDIIRWLKSLRPQNKWKPSDEQMDALHYVTNFDYEWYKATLVSLYEQLKKLKE